MIITTEDVVEVIKERAKEVIFPKKDEPVVSSNDLLDAILVANMHYGICEYRAGEEQNPETKRALLSESDLHLKAMRMLIPELRRRLNGT